MIIDSYEAITPHIAGSFAPPSQNEEKNMFSGKHPIHLAGPELGRIRRKIRVDALQVQPLDTHL